MAGLHRRSHRAAWATDEHLQGAEMQDCGKEAWHRSEIGWRMDVGGMLSISY